MFGALKIFISDDETDMRRKDIDDWDMYSRPTLKYEAPHQKSMVCGMIQCFNAFSGIRNRIADH